MGEENIDYEKEYYALSAKTKIMEVDEENLISAIIQSKSKVEELRNDIGIIINTIMKKRKLLSNNELFPKPHNTIYTKSSYSNTDQHIQRSPISESKDRRRRSKAQRELVLNKPRKQYSTKSRHTTHESGERSSHEIDSKLDASDTDRMI